MKYYVRIGTGAPQVLTAPEIFALVKQGTVNQSTKACVVGATQWTDLGVALPDLFKPGAEAPTEGGATEFLGKAGHFLAETSGEVAGLAKVFARRIFASNFAAEAALPEERVALERSETPISSPMAQNYVAWRRAILWVAGIALSIAALITFINEFNGTFGANIPPVLRFILVGIQVLNILAPILILRAALRWTHVRRSRRLARFGWLCQFLGPILLMLIPVKELTTNEQLAAFLSETKWTQELAASKKVISKMTDETQRKEQQKKLEESEKKFRESGQKEEIAAMKTMLDTGQKNWEAARKDKKEFSERVEKLVADKDQAAGMYLAITALMAAQMAVTALITLLPRIFGMFPGIVRASLTLRTLVPESPLPGYVVALIEPLYMLLVLVFVVLSSQLSEWQIFNGLICLLGSGYFLLSNARSLAKPADSAGMTAHLKPLRKKMLICTVIGLVLITAGIADYISQIGFWSITGTVCHLVGNIILLTAVGADFLLGLMKFSFDQDQAMRGTPLQADLENRFTDLAQARLAQISDEPPPPLPEGIASR